MMAYYIFVGAWAVALIFLIGFECGSYHQYTHMKTCPGCKEEMREILKQEGQ